jgi:hypothetical protein
MPTGQNMHDPLTQLNSQMGFGVLAELDPCGKVGLSPNNPNMACTSFFGGRHREWHLFSFVLECNYLLFIIDRYEFTCFSPTSFSDNAQSYD